MYFLHRECRVAPVGAITCADHFVFIVPHTLTVLSSYAGGASVPLAPAAGANKMASRCDALRRPAMVARVYSNWVGHAVVLQVVAADLRVPLHGTIVGESDEAVRFRVGEGWDIDIYKNMILAVEDWASVLT
jgi:hypothetical protein